MVSVLSHQTKFTNWVNLILARTEKINECGIELPDKDMIPLVGSTGRLPSFLQPLNAVEWVEPAESGLDDQAVVFGLLIEGQAWALSWRLLSHHHVANITVAGVPIVVTWCNICSGGAAFKRKSSGEELSFSPVALHNGTFVMRDDIYGNIWKPFSGSLLSGGIEKQALERVDLTQCFWQEWQELNQNTLAAKDKHSKVFGGDTGPGERKTLPKIFERSLIHRDDRLTEMRLVLGITYNGFTCAYCVDELIKLSPVSRHKVSGLGVVIFSDNDSLMLRACFSEVKGKPLNFRVDSLGQYFDKETGSQWDRMGRAITGPLKGEEMVPCPSVLQSWYTWVAEYPETMIWNG